jgi:hypothetical protein
MYITYTKLQLFKYRAMYFVYSFFVFILLGLSSKTLVGLSLATAIMNTFPNTTMVLFIQVTINTYIHIYTREDPVHIPDTRLHVRLA